MTEQQQILRVLREHHGPWPTDVTDAQLLSATEGTLLLARIRLSLAIEPLRRGMAHFVAELLNRYRTK